MNFTQRSRTLGLFRQRIVASLFWMKTATYSTVFLFFWGIAVLALRVWGVDDLRSFGMALCGLLAVPLFAWFTARRGIPEDRQLGAILDGNNAAGGLLMSSFETEIGSWSEQVGELQVPTLRWDSKRMFLLGTLAVVFAVTSLVLPISQLSGGMTRRLNIDDQVRKLTSQLEALQDEKLLTVEEVEAKKLELQKIQKDADGLGPVKTFDAMDHLADQVNQKASEAVEQAQKMTETFARMESLSQKVQEIKSELDPSTAKSLMEGLAQSVEEMLKENEPFAKELKEQLAKKEKEKKEQQKKDKEKGQNGDKKDGEECENCQNENGDQGKKGEKGKNGKQGENGTNGENDQEMQADGQNKQNQDGSEGEQDAMAESLKKMIDEKKLNNMTPEQMQQLAEAMKECRGDCQRMCEKLQDAGFPMDKESLKQLAENQQVEKEEAERMLSDLWANCDCDNQGEKNEGEPRDPNAPKVSPRYTKKQDWTTDPNAPPEDTMFQKNADEEGAEFKAKYLPPAKLEAFRNSQKIGASISAPTVKPSKPETQSALQQTEGGIGTAHGQTIYPQHRGPVGRYFEK